MISTLRCWALYLLRPAARLARRVGLARRVRRIAGSGFDRGRQALVRVVIRFVPDRLIRLGRWLVHSVLPPRFRTRKYVFGLPVAGFGMLMLAAVAVLGRPAPPVALVGPPEIGAGRLTIEAPDTVAAGDGFRIAVSGIADSVGDVTVFVDTGYRLIETDAVASDGRAFMDIAPIDDPASGVITLTAVAGPDTGNANLKILPGPAADPIELFLGPRTVEANAIAGPMLAVVPTDGLGNPVAAGTGVNVGVHRPDFEYGELNLATSRLMAWTRIRSGTLAGRTRVAATVDQAAGNEMSFLEIAGIPAPFEAFGLDPAAPADGRSVVRFRTTPLLDPHDNVMPDGLSVFADVVGPGGTRRLTAQVVGGIAEFSLQAPSRPGTEVITVTASGTVSSPLEIDFFAMVTDFEARATMGDQGVVIEIGPLVAATGAYPPDGTEVTIRSEHGVLTRPLFEGHTQTVIPATREPIELEVLGATTTVAVS